MSLSSSSSLRSLTQESPSAATPRASSTFSPPKTRSRAALSSLDNQHSPVKALVAKFEEQSSNSSPRSDARWAPRVTGGARYSPGGLGVAALAGAPRRSAAIRSRALALAAVADTQTETESDESDQSDESDESIDASTYGTFDNLPPLPVPSPSDGGSKRDRESDPEDDEHRDGDGEGRRRSPGRRRKRRGTAAAGPPRSVSTASLDMFPAAAPTADDESSSDSSDSDGEGDQDGSPEKRARTAGRAATRGDDASRRHRSRSRRRVRKPAAPAAEPVTPSGHKRAVLTRRTVVSAALDEYAAEAQEAHRTMQYQEAARSPASPLLTLASRTYSDELADHEAAAAVARTANKFSTPAPATPVASAAPSSVMSRMKTLLSPRSEARRARAASAAGEGTNRLNQLNSAATQAALGALGPLAYAYELRTVEANFVRDARILADFYAEVMVSCGEAHASSIRDAFSNAASFYSTHRDLLDALDKAGCASVVSLADELRDAAAQADGTAALEKRRVALTGELSLALGNLRISSAFSPLLDSLIPMHQRFHVSRMASSPASTKESLANAALYSLQERSSSFAAAVQRLERREQLTVQALLGKIFQHLPRYLLLIRELVAHLDPAHADMSRLRSLHATLSTAMSDINAAGTVLQQHERAAQAMSMLVAEETEVGLRSAAVAAGATADEARTAVAVWGDSGASEARAFLAAYNAAAHLNRARDALAASPRLTMLSEVNKCAMASRSSAGRLLLASTGVRLAEGGTGGILIDGGLRYELHRRRHQAEGTIPLDALAYDLIRARLAKDEAAADEATDSSTGGAASGARPAKSPFVLYTFSDGYVVLAIRGPGATRAIVRVFSAEGTISPQFLVMDRHMKAQLDDDAAALLTKELRLSPVMRLWGVSNWTAAGSVKTTDGGAVVHSLSPPSPGVAAYSPWARAGLRFDSLQAKAATEHLITMTFAAAVNAQDPDDAGAGAVRTLRAGRRARLRVSAPREGDEDTSAASAVTPKKQKRLKKREPEAARPIWQALPIELDIAPPKFR